MVPVVGCEVVVGTVAPGVPVPLVPVPFVPEPKLDEPVPKLEEFEEAALPPRRLDLAFNCSMRGS